MPVIRQRATDKKGKLHLAQDAFQDLLKESLQHGFHGAASLTLSVQDGHIQHLKVSVEKMIK